MHTLADVGGRRQNPKVRARLGTATERTIWNAVAVASIVTSGLTATKAGASPAPTDDRRSLAPVVDGALDAYTARLDAGAYAALQAAGVDVEHLAPTTGPEGPTVDAVLTSDQADRLAGQGVDLEPKLVKGVTTSEAARRDAANARAWPRTGHATPVPRRAARDAPPGGRRRAQGRKTRGRAAAGAAPSRAS
jgi:hypothetical protein